MAGAGEKGLLFDEVLRQIEKDYPDEREMVQMGDTAGGTGKCRAEVAQASAGQTQIVAKLPPYDVRSRFGPYDFTLSISDTGGGKTEMRVITRDRRCRLV